MKDSYRNKFIKDWNLQKEAYEKYLAEYANK